MRLIMVATDDSESGNRAIDAAAAFARAEAAKLLVITVVEPSEIKARNFAHLALSEGGIGEALGVLAGDILHRAEQRARRLGVVSVDVEYCWGDPGEAIIAAGRRANADVIVVGRRGRGRLAGMLLGSVSQKVASSASCPVLVIP